MNLSVAYFESPIGLIMMEAKGENIVGISFVDAISMSEKITPVLQEAKKQMKEYFEGRRKEFDLPIALEGTEFEQKVWRALKEIEYGSVASYKDVAQKIGHNKAYRAIGGTNHKNKLAIVIPCHRVIGSNGKMTGYAGGIWRKTWLIGHEKKNSKNNVYETQNIQG